MNAGASIETECASKAASQKVSFLEFAGEPSRQCFLYQPATALPGAPLVVSIHGIARNAAAHVYRLMQEADQLGVCVLAPLFEKAKYGQYQQLVDARIGVRSDIALIEMVEHVATLTGTDSMRLLLLGYSGGAQFAHRFAMAYPERVASAVLAAAGWYTMPDLTLAYPLGIDVSQPGRDLCFDASAFLQVPMHVYVGEFDTVRDGSLRRSDLIDNTQGRTRVDRAHNWVKAMRIVAAERGAPSLIDISLLCGVAHSFSDAIEKSDLARRAFAHFALDAAPGPAKVRGESNGQ